MKLAAVIMVRDEEAVIATNLAYHRSLGIDEFWIVDNGSTDGTAGILASEERSHGDVRWRSDPGLFLQSEVFTALASEAMTAGADWIVPIDADEFWWSRDAALRVILGESQGLGGFLCEVDNFVQRRSVRRERRGSLTTMTYRAEPTGTAEDARELVEAGDIGFVEIVYPRKQLLRASADLVIGFGNHESLNVAGPIEETHAIRVLHAPIRARSTLDRRAQFGERMAAADSNPGAGWHMRRLLRLASEGSLDADWRANSQRFGRLNVNGDRRKLVRDLRLRNAIAPFV